MGSCLNIYLERKKKEGEEKGERLLLCSISRADNIYSMFYDNSIGTCVKSKDKTIHEFTVSDFDDIDKHIDDLIMKCLIRISEQKDTLPLISDKDSIATQLEAYYSDKEYLQELLSQKVTLNTLYSIFSDIGKYSDFNQVYWTIE